MTGLDTSGLISLALSSHPLHRQTRLLVEAAYEQPDATFAVTPLVLSEFVHCVTDPRRFAAPMTTVEALDWTEALLHLAEVKVIEAGSAALGLWLRWMREFRLGRKRTLDTQLAATLHTSGVDRLLTGNPDDFRVFGVFELLVPQPH